MEDTLRKEFEERCISKAGEAVKYAVQRNIIVMLQEIEHRNGMAADNDCGTGDDNIMTIRLCIVHDNYYAAKIRVKDCSWNRKITYKDDDFPEEDIDARQPDMFEEYAKSVRPMDGGESDSGDSETEIRLQQFRASVKKAAKEMNAPYYEVCQDRSVPMHSQYIDKLSPDGELTRRMAPQADMRRIMEAAADQGGIVRIEDTLATASIVKLLRNGYDVYVAENYWGDVWHLEETDAGVAKGGMADGGARKLLADGGIVLISDDFE